jgi:hypothetical protein
MFSLINHTDITNLCICITTGIICIKIKIDFEKTEMGCEKSAYLTQDSKKRQPVVDTIVLLYLQALWQHYLGGVNYEVLYQPTFLFSRLHVNLRTVG